MRVFEEEPIGGGKEKEEGAILEKEKVSILHFSSSFYEKEGEYVCMTQALFSFFLRFDLIFIHVLSHVDVASILGTLKALFFH